MKHTWRKTAAFVLALAMAAGCAPLANGGGFLSENTAIVASAATTLDSSTTTWSGDCTMSGSLTITGPVTVTSNITLTIPAGEILTVTGAGKLIVSGEDGSEGAYGEEGEAGGNGTNGGDGFTGNIIINGGASVTVNGGEGGKGGTSGFTDGGNGGNGGAGVNGNVTVNNGSAFLMRSMPAITMPCCITTASHCRSTRPSTAQISPWRST